MGKYKKKMFRDFLKRTKSRVSQNYLKDLKVVKQDIQKNADVSFSDVEFMLWANDLEFFTIDYAAGELNFNKDNLANRHIYPLTKLGYLYKHFPKLSPSQSMEDHIFRDETKWGYRTRYALTQKGRNIVKKVYKMLG
tara:strand:+ start:3460 stop:3870 length:411 start_codon:yes stop_codon:yes gene_type:complete